MFPCYSLNSSHPLLPLLCPQVRSLCLNCTSPLNMVLLVHFGTYSYTALGNDSLSLP